MKPRQPLHFGRYDYASYSAFTCYAICSLVIPIVLVVMARDLSFPLTDGGMAAGGLLHLARSVAMVAALLLCGGLAGYIGKRFTMGFCILFMGAGILLCGFSPMYWLLFPGLIIAGLGEGICEGIATPFVQSLHPKDAPERYVTISHSFWSVGVGICVLLAGGLLSMGVNWRFIMIGSGVLTLLVSLLFLWRENPRAKYPEDAQKTSFGTVWNYTKAIAKVPRFWVYCFGMFMGAGSEFCLTFWAATYLQLNFNASAWMAGLGTASIALGMFLGRSVFGYFSTRSNLKVILLASSICTIPLSLLIILLTPEFFQSSTLLFGTLFSLLFLSGIGISPFWPSLQMHGVNNLPELDSTMLFICFSAIGIPGSGFFTWMIGVLGDNVGLKNAFYLIPASLVVFAITIFLEGWVFKSRNTTAGN